VAEGGSRAVGIADTRKSGIRRTLEEAVEVYDPGSSPDPKRWLALEEPDRLDLVQTAVDNEPGVPNPKLHAAFHLIVENQAAMGDETPVAATLERLVNEGLDRHEAVHAVGSVLSSHVFRVLELGGEALDGGEPNESYWLDLDSLTAARWRPSR